MLPFSAQLLLLLLTEVEISRTLRLLWEAHTFSTLLVAIPHASLTNGCLFSTSSLFILVVLLIAFLLL